MNQLTLTLPLTDRVVTDAASLYQQALESLRLLERFPQPDWSIADYRVARWLLQRDFSTAGVTAGPPATEPRLSTLSSQPRGLSAPDRARGGGEPGARR